MNERVPSTPARRSGFTLIEILAVVAIMGISAAVVIPNLGPRNDLKANAAARVLMADLIYAQQRAVALQKVHYVRFNTSAGEYDVLTSLSPSAVRITHPVDRNPFVVTLGSGSQAALSGVTLQRASFDDQLTIAFDELGIPMSYNGLTGIAVAMTVGEIDLVCGVHKLRVSVQPFSGEVKVAPF